MGWSDDELAAMVGKDIQEGWVVNLGIGLPTLVMPHLYGREVLVHSENGIVGMGPRPAPGAEDPDVVNAGKEFATVIPGGSFVDSVLSFALMRGGRLDLCVVGAYQVSFTGDLANWRLPGRRVAGIGGAADLAFGARYAWVMMKYFAPNGQPKLVRRCTYPLTARAVVDRIYTDQGVFECGAAGPRLVRPAPNIDLETVLKTISVEH